MEIKRPGIFGEIFGRIVAVADGGDLELELDEFRIEKFKEQVIRPLAIDLGQLKILVVETLTIPADAARSPIRLYSSAARFTSSSLGCFGPSRLEQAFASSPTSFAQAIRSS